MHINKFKKVGKNKYKIFLDTTELTLYEDIILKYDLLLKKDISLEEIDKLIYVLEHRDNIFDIIL